MAVSDAELVRRSCGGDQAAFGELVRRHRNAALALASRLVGDPEQAQDLTQETFLRAYTRLAELHDPERFRPWVLAIGRSTCANWLQAQAIRRRLETGRPLVFEPLPPTPEAELERRQTAREVRQLVEGLPEPYRGAASRYYLEAQPQPRIAEELGVALGTVKARVHHARRKLERAVTAMSKDWCGRCEWPEEREPTMTPEELARAALKRYDLGEFEAVGSVYEPSDSIGIGVRTTKGQYRLWRYHGYMTPEVVELEHAMLEHLVECGVPCKRLVPAGDGATWQEIDRQLVAIFEWFSGESPDLTKRQGALAVADLHAKWTRAMEDFDPPIDGWRRLATDWRPRKSWAWVAPTEELPLVPERMGFFAAARDVEDPPPHHDRMLAQVRDTEARLQRFADKVQEAGLADLPRGMNHGVFLFGSMDWELMVTDGDDCQYESRVGDLGRLIYALHDREMPPHQLRDRVTLAVDTYRQQVELSPEEVRALPLLAWGQFLFYDTFHILLYLYELDGADRGAGFVARRTDQWVRIRDEWERRFEELGEALSGR